MKNINYNMANELINFEHTPIRKTLHDEEWYFSIIDIIAALIESSNHQTYWYVLKKREPQLLTICKKFKFLATDGKMRPTDCANTEGVFRIIMSVPSPKAEPLKMWLAEQGKRAIDEAENPELLTQRQIEMYRAKGYPDEWINERVKNIDIRKQLTEEWKGRGVQEGQEFSILTAVIAKGTFGLIPSEHKKVKGLTKPSQNLRDHMTNLELIFTSLGEELTREETINEDAQGFEENKNAALKGGNMAGKLLKTLEKERGKKVVSPKNYLNLINGEKTEELPPSE
jgi:DNA-damage-inducible protein D